MGAGWPLFNGSRAPGPSAGLDGQAKLGESPAPTRARWRSGYAEDCKSLHAGSIPARASKLSADCLPPRLIIIAAAVLLASCGERAQTSIRDARVVVTGAGAAIYATLDNQGGGDRLM